MKKYIMIVALICIPSIGYTDNSGIGIQLPQSQSAYGQDSIRAGDLDCKNAIGGATQLEFGVTGVIDNYDSPFNSNNNDPFQPSSRDIGVYARIVIPLDKPKERINCNSLYELELRKKRLEVLKLQQELEALKRLNESGGQQFEN